MTTDYVTQLEGTGWQGDLARPAAGNRVLRNTYLLLAVTMLPTVLGAWLALASGLSGVMMRSPILMLLVFLAISFGLITAVQRTQHSAMGIVWLLVFTGFMGAMISPLLGSVLGSYRNGAQLVAMAFGATAAVFFTMAGVASVTKRDLSRLSQLLTVGLVLTLIAMIPAMIWPSLALALTINALVALIFSAFIVVDVKRILDGGQTNYIGATLQLYLDVINLFQALLSLLSVFAGRRD